MLDKIINIKPEYRYKEGSGSHFGFQKFLQNSGGNKFLYHDSISFSPAAIFLTKINWQLKDIDLAPNKKLSLIFSTYDFEFSTEIDFLEFYSDPRHYYNITKDFLTFGKKIRLMIRMSTRKNPFHLDENIERVNLSGLDRLFERIYNLEISGEIDKYDSSVLRDLMDGIHDDILNEFNFIDTAFYTLVSKLGTFKIFDNYNFNNERTEPIIIEKITAING